MLDTAAQAHDLLPPDEAGKCVLSADGQLFRGAPDELRAALDGTRLRFHAGGGPGSLSPGSSRGSRPSAPGRLVSTRSTTLSLVSGGARKGTAERIAHEPAPHVSQEECTRAPSPQGRKNAPPPAAAAPTSTDERVRVRPGERQARGDRVQGGDAVHEVIEVHGRPAIRKTAQRPPAGPSGKSRGGGKGSRVNGPDPTTMTTAAPTRAANRTRGRNTEPVVENSHPGDQGGPDHERDRVRSPRPARAPPPQTRRRSPRAIAIPPPRGVGVRCDGARSGVVHEPQAERRRPHRAGWRRVSRRPRSRTPPRPRIRDASR